MKLVTKTAFCAILLLIGCTFFVACQSNNLSPEQARLLMFNLLAEDGVLAEQALGEIVSLDNGAFAPLLIDMLWASPTDLFALNNADLLADSLASLTDQSFGTDWEAWARWVGSTEIEPLPDLVEWKGAFFGRIDPQFTSFFNGQAADSFQVSEIIWGGVGVDGIPPLEQLQQVPVADSRGYSPHDAVFGLSINGDSRAYPLRVVDWHEMVNDVVGGVPISIAYCTLCSAAIAYEGQTASGQQYDFGTSGLLYRSNKLMYDRQTNSLWNQLTGEPVLGEAVERGESLNILPIVLTSWGDWQAEHPDTTILPLDTGFIRDYSSGAAYGDYFVSDELLFPVGVQDDRLALKDHIFALRVGNVAKAYPLVALTEIQVVNDRLGREEVVLVSAETNLNVHGYSYELEYISYSAGAEVRAFERNGQTFSLGEDPNTLFDEDGATWQITETALVGPNGEQLARLGGHLAYWFGWVATHPDTLLFNSND